MPKIARTRTELRKEAQRHVLGTLMASALPCLDDDEELKAEVQRQCDRVFNFLGYEPQPLDR